MKIEDEYEPNIGEKKTGSKVATIVSILIVITLIAVVAIVIAMLYMQQSKLSVYIDGQKVNIPDGTFLFTEGTNDIYVSIKDIAPLVGYEAHNGEYKVNSEDTNKMYVESKDGTETASFFLNSTVISKVPPESNEDYENIQISQPVAFKNNKLYVNTDGFMQGFNVMFSYDKEKNNIVIQTLPYLVSYYMNNVTNYGYDVLSEDFNNQKALVYGMLVASKEATGKYGVVDIRTGSEIISPRYNNIEFIENSREFLITNASDKVGIAYATGDIKINVLYDEIKVMDSTRGYYLVKSNSKYGVINDEEELVIHIEYDKIGVDLAEFANDEIKNRYILYDKVIPVCLNNKWGFFTVDGTRLTDMDYDTVGCKATELTDRAVNNAMIYGDEEVIVVSRDGFYGGVSTKGDVLVPLRFTYVFSRTIDGETKYYVEYNETDYDASDYISIMKKNLGYEEDTNEDEEEQENQEEQTRR